MNCQKAGDLLSAYIDGELTGRHCEALEAHVGHCAGCREELETLRSTIALLAAPKTMARPEGLLEEFKAKYLPEAETAAAPRWGIWLPVMPRFEWPSLGRVMLPMGGLAAAAALLVALHSQPLVVAHPQGAPAPAARTLAALPAASTEASSAAALAAPRAARAEGETARVENGARLRTAPTGEKSRTGFGEPRALAALNVPHRRSRHRAMAFAAAVHPHHPRHQRPDTYQLVVRPRLAPPVDPDVLKQAELQHENAVPSPEVQWQDQVVMIRRTATAAPTDEGYGEASCKDLVTGKTEKSIAIGGSPSPAVPAGAPAGDSGGGK